MKSVANYMSIARMVLALILIFTEPLSAAFFVVYFLCGISDILDGYIARKLNTTSKLGEKLDSAADLIMDAVLIIILYPIVNPTVEILLWIAIIAIIRIVSVIVVFAKYRTFGMIHTYANKVTGLILFIFPLLLSIIQSHALIYAICVIATLSAVEEFVIDLLSKELQANKKSLFIK